MSKDPFELMRSGAHYNDVLKTLAKIGKFDLDNRVAELSDERYVEIATYTSTTCRAIGIQKTLIFGGLMHLFYAASDVDGRRELFDNMLEDLGVSRTQAYRSMAVWCKFGTTLLSEPGISKSFSSESLKILAGEETPDAARNAALEMARNGERVSIKIAVALKEKHSPGTSRNASADTAASSSTGGRRKSRWRFLGSVVRVVLEPLSPPEATATEAIIRDLEEATDQLRRELVAAE